jgi:hypothetical protein
MNWIDWKKAVEEAARKYEKAEAILPSCTSTPPIQMAFISGATWAKGHLSQDKDSWGLVVSMARDIVVTSRESPADALKRAQQFYSYVEAIEKFAKKEAGK